MILPSEENYRQICVQKKVIASQICKNAHFAKASCFLPETQYDFTQLLMRIIGAETRINRLKIDLRNKIAKKGEKPEAYLHKMFQSVVYADKDPSELDYSLLDNLTHGSTSKTHLDST